MPKADSKDNEQPKPRTRPAPPPTPFSYSVILATTTCRDALPCLLDAPSLKLLAGLSC